MSKIKSRLKTAYENVEYYANSTWDECEDVYQKANQELHTRECKVRDSLTDEILRPRTVRESIPHSRLAQYANYEYSEARELSYASSASNVSFYYPCLYKNGCITEPWMIPEIEHMLIWFTYSPDFSIVDILRREEINQFEECEKVKFHNAPCCWHEFHELYPAFYRALEKTPGYTRYTSSTPVTPVDISKYQPPLLRANTFEEMILRMKITSDKIKCLWTDKQIKIPRSIYSQINLLNLPQRRRCFTKYHLRNTTKNYNGCVRDIKNMPIPVEMPEQTNKPDSSNQQAENFAANTKQPTPLVNKHVSNADICNLEEVLTVRNEIPPTRRLYSAVLQGISTTGPKTLSSSTDMKSSANSSPNKNTLSQTNISPVKSEKSIGDSKTTNQQYSRNCAAKKYSQDSTNNYFKESRSNYNFMQESTQNAPTVLFCSSQPVPSSGIAQHNSNLLNICSATSYSNLSNSHFGNAFINNSCCVNSMCPGSNYLNVSSQYPSYHNNIFCSNVYPNCSYQSSPILPPNSRCTIPQNTNRQPYQPSHPLWYAQHNKTPNMYMQPHYIPQPYYYTAPSTPQPQPFRQNQRWSNATNYSKPASAFQQTQSFQNLSPTQWGLQNQNLYRSTSNQHIPQQLSDYYSQSGRTKGKCATGTVDNSAYSIDNYERFCNLSRSSSSSDVVYSSPDANIQVRTSLSTSSVDLGKLSIVERNPHIITIKGRNESSSILPIVTTASEELERQALEQYQPSDDAVYQELERQAEEQYDDDPENWISPPNECMLFGGLVVFNIGIEEFLIILLWYL